MQCCTFKVCAATNPAQTTFSMIETCSCAGFSENWKRSSKANNLFTFFCANQFQFFFLISKVAMLLVFLQRKSSVVVITNLCDEVTWRISREPFQIGCWAQRNKHQTSNQDTQHLLLRSFCHSQCDFVTELWFLMWNPEKTLFEDVQHLL